MHKKHKISIAILVVGIALWKISRIATPLNDSRVSPRPTQMQTSGEGPITVDRRLRMSEPFDGVSGGCATADKMFVVIRNDRAVPSLLSWSFKSGMVETVVELPSEVDNGKWKPSKGGINPYSYYPRLQVNLDGSHVLITPGTPQQNTQHALLIDIAEGILRSVGQSYESVGILSNPYFDDNGEIVRFCDNTVDSPYFASVYEYRYGTHAHSNVFSIQRDAIQPRFASCQYLRRDEDRYFVLHFMPPMHEAIGFVDMRHGDRLIVLGNDSLGSLGGYAKRYFTSDAEYIATRQGIWRLQGDSIRERLIGIKSANKLIDLSNGNYECVGWSVDNRLVAFVGGTTTVFHVGKHKAGREDSFIGDQALIVFDSTGKEIASFTPSTPCRLEYVSWTGDAMLNFYNPSDGRYCVWELERNQMKWSPFKILYHNSPSKQALDSDGLQDSGEAENRSTEVIPKTDAVSSPGPSGELASHFSILPLGTHEKDIFTKQKKPPDSETKIASGKRIRYKQVRYFDHLGEVTYTLRSGKSVSTTYHFKKPNDERNDGLAELYTELASAIAVRSGDPGYYSFGSAFHRFSHGLPPDSLWLVKTLRSASATGLFSLTWFTGKEHIQLTVDQNEYVFLSLETNSSVPEYSGGVLRHPDGLLYGVTVPAPKFLRNFYRN